MRPEVVRLAWIVAAIAVTVLLLQRLASVLVPFLGAALLAYLCAPFVTWLQSKRVPRLLAVMLVMCVAVLIVVGLMLVVVPTIGAQISALLEELPQVIEWYRHTVVPWAHDTLRIDLPDNAERARTVAANALQAGGDLSQRLVPSLTSGGLALLSLLGMLVLLPVLLFYFLLDWDRIIATLETLVPPRHLQQVTALVAEIDAALSAFFRGQLSVMIGLGMFYSAALAIVGLDSALSIGIITGTLCFVPYLGFTLGLVLGTLAALLQFQTVSGLVWVWVVFGLGQILEGYVLTPWLVGHRVGLHPVWVLFAVLAGGALLGFIGMLLAVPAAAVLLVLLRHAKAHYLASRFYTS
jgi:predicted PurR-regulated permease PerM